MNEIEVRGAIERLENPNATAWFYSPEEDVKLLIEFAKLHLANRKCMQQIASTARQIIIEGKASPRRSCAKVS